MIYIYIHTCTRARVYACACVSIRRAARRWRSRARARCGRRPRPSSWPRRDAASPATGKHRRNDDATLRSPTRQAACACKRRRGCFGRKHRLYCCAAAVACAQGRRSGPLGPRWPVGLFVRRSYPEWWFACLLVLLVVPNGCLFVCRVVPNGCMFVCRFVPNGCLFVCRVVPNDCSCSCRCRGC
jgi:hypothetical protein